MELFQYADDTLIHVATGQSIEVLQFVLDRDSTVLGFAAKELLQGIMNIKLKCIIV